MITHIKGRLSEKSPTNVVIETNGIGYWINISLTTFSQIPDGLISDTRPGLYMRGITVLIEPKN